MAGMRAGRPLGNERVPILEHCILVEVETGHSATSVSLLCPPACPTCVFRDPVAGLWLASASPLDAV
jgi:hypothetical protein